MESWAVSQLHAVSFWHDELGEEGEFGPCLKAVEGEPKVECREKIGQQSFFAWSPSPCLGWPRLLLAWLFGPELRPLQQVCGLYGSKTHVQPIRLSLVRDPLL